MEKWWRELQDSSMAGDDDPTALFKYYSSYSKEEDSEEKVVEKFGLPSNIGEKKKWLNAMGLPETILQMKDITIFVCARHFNPSDLRAHGKSFRVDTAKFPTLRLSKINWDAEILDGNVLKSGVSSEPTIFVPPEEVVTPVPKLSGQIKRKSTVDREDFLIKKYKSSRQQVRRLQKKLKQFEQMASIFNCFNDLPEHTQEFIKLLMSSSNVDPQARIYTPEQKNLCLMLYKQNSSTYRSMRDMFGLPSISTLIQHHNNIPCPPGLNALAFHYLSKVVPTMKPIDRHCVIMWDEIHLRPNLRYDRKMKRIIGTEDYGFKRSRRIADHAIVFLLRGVHSGWKIPVYYGFVQNGTKAEVIQEILKKIVNEIKNRTSLNIVSSICDQYGANVRAIKQLIDDSNIQRGKAGQRERSTILIGGMEMVPLFDPPHILKGIRNNLLNKSFIIDWTLGSAIGGNFFSWSTFETIYQWDLSRGLGPNGRKLVKINDKHINKKKIKKMRVGVAAKVFSKSMSDVLKEAAHKFKGSRFISNDGSSITDGELMAASVVTELVNNVFDSFNGVDLMRKNKRNIRRGLSKKKNVKKANGVANQVTVPEYRVPITLQNEEKFKKFWQDAKLFLQKCRYYCLSQKKMKEPQTLKSIVFNLGNYPILWEKLKQNGFTAFEPRKINQDPLESLFGRIRRCCGENRSPTCSQFVGIIKCVLIVDCENYTIVGSNVEQDEDEFVFKNIGKCLIEKFSQDLHHHDIEIHPPPLPFKAESRFAISIPKKIVDPLVQKISCHKDCLCNLVLVKKSISESSMLDDGLFLLASHLDSILEDKLYMKNLDTVVGEELSRSLIDSIRSWYPCEKHKLVIQDELTRLVKTNSNILIEQWCYDIGKILSGSIMSFPKHNTYIDAFAMSQKFTSRKNLKLKSGDVLIKDISTKLVEEKEEEEDEVDEELNYEEFENSIDGNNKDDDDDDDDDDEEDPEDKMYWSDVGLLIDFLDQNNSLTK